MRRRFNVTGVCIPGRHYMVDISRQLEQIRAMIDNGDYFTINRARQYGKTTTLFALSKLLSGDYLVISLDFQAIGNDSFQNENTFSLAFILLFLRCLRRLPKEETAAFEEQLAKLQELLEKKEKQFVLIHLFDQLLEICRLSPRPIVLMIDEVDSAADNQVFLDFLAQLRNYYLERETFGTPAFHSVILAGVYDVKNLKRKLRSDEAHKVNSPWNIAAEFSVDMSFHRDGISGMLSDYEADSHTGMDIEEMSGLLYDYTSGFPFLVSRLCQLMDEGLGGDVYSGSGAGSWSKEGFFEAVRILLDEKNTLFDSLRGKLQDDPELDASLKKILFSGVSIPYNAYESTFEIAAMLGFIKKNHGKVAIANRIFETWLYNLYLSGTELKNIDISMAAQQDMSQFVTGGRLNMRCILERFVVHFHDLYGDSDVTFVENVGRKFFLLYLRPIINGTGNYYVEAQTRDLGRTDVIVDYRGEQFVIELKVWRGSEYNRRGEAQLMGYLDSYHIDTGYMLSFNFNKKKEIGVREIVLGNKTLIEAVV